MDVKIEYNDTCWKCKVRIHILSLLLTKTILYTMNVKIVE